eukprot:TRINITY_DN2491_c0_g5_i1.p1 TRINITY_DN2491_c0_g5~~TRINITY_DN2491_c0_g5_i1.p1  ORF type:complete len:712 (+),score=116.18 TRINITY_DN2491_c0_g5_i1:174-2309(+)
MSVPTLHHFAISSTVRNIHRPEVISKLATISSDACEEIIALLADRGSLYPETAKQLLLVHPRSLTLTNCVDLPSSFFLATVSIADQLQSLDVRGCSQLHGTALVPILERARSLSRLCLDGSHMDAELVLLLINQASQFTELCFAPVCPRPASPRCALLCDLLAGATRLERLSLGGPLTAEVISKLSSATLTALSVSYYRAGTNFVSLLERCPALTSLSLECVHFARFCSDERSSAPLQRLKLLSLVDCTELQFAPLLGPCALEEFRLRRCSFCDDATDLGSLLANSVLLRVVDMDEGSLWSFCAGSSAGLQSISCSGAEEGQLCPIVAAASQLRELVVEVEASGDTLLQACTCSTLQVLELFQCGNVGPVLVEIAPKLRNLTKLSMKLCNVNDSIFEVLGITRKLQYLRLSDQTIDDGVLCSLRMSPNLTFVDVSHTNVSDAGVQDLLSMCPNLSTLRLEACPEISDRALLLVSQCTQLLGLHLQASSQVSDVGLSAVLQSCTLLHDLTVPDSCTSDSLQVMQEYSRNLRSLDVSWCEQIDDECVSALAARCCKLTRLSCRKCTIGTEAVGAITRHLTALRSLVLTRCETIADSALRGIGDTLTALTHLNVSWVWNLTNDTFVHITQRCPLIRLNVSGCKRLTDVCLRGLASTRPMLRSLNASWCDGISDDALRDVCRHCVGVLRAVNYYGEVLEVPSSEFVTWHEIPQQD